MRIVNLVPRRRVAGPLSFSRDMDRMFNGFFDSVLPERALTVPLWEAAGEFNPRLDVAETDKEIRVSVELPGVDEKDVKVELEDGILVIKGEKKEEHEKKDGEWHRQECRYGSFVRTIHLPDGVSSDKVKAVFKKGLLKVTLLKEEEKSKKRKVVEIIPE